MAHGLNSVLKRGVSGVQGCKSEGKTGIGSRRIFPPHFKLQVLDSYRNDADCKGNQRATARKYGIHRRQIQKWLQVENVLRNSVNKGSSGSGTAPGPKSADCGNANNNGGEIPEARKCGIDVALSNRQRDDVGCADMCPPAATSGVPDARVPSLAPPYGALDYTTHSRRSDDPAAPMDLSFKRPASRSAPVLSVSFAPLLASPLASPPLASTPSSLVSTTTTTTATHPDVWDLSTKTKTKRKCDEDRLVSPKPVKLFKPYLNDDDDDDVDHDNNDVDVDVDGDVEDRLPPSRLELVAPVKLEPLPCCPYIHDAAYYYNNNNNNNNNVCDIKSEYNNVPYTLHELQPKSSIHYYYTDKTGGNCPLTIVHFHLFDSSWIWS